MAVQKNVLDDFTEFVIDDDGTFHPLAGSNVDGATDNVEVRLRSEEPAGR